MAMEQAEKEMDSEKNRPNKINQVSYQVVPDNQDPMLKVYVIIFDGYDVLAEQKKRDKLLGGADERRKGQRKNDTGESNAVQNKGEMKLARRKEFLKNIQDSESEK